VPKPPKEPKPQTTKKVRAKKSIVDKLVMPAEPKPKTPVEEPIPVVPVIQPAESMEPKMSYKPETTPLVIPELKMISAPILIKVKKPRKTRKLLPQIISDVPPEVQTEKLEKDIKPTSEIEQEKKKEEKIKPMTDAKTKQLIQEFKRNGIPVLETASENQIAAIILLSNKVYYNTQTPLMTDGEYDIVKDYMEQKYPNNIALKQIGAPVDKNKVTLPYEMASMDKIKPDTYALSNWKKKYIGPYVISCKLDGVSGMYSTEGESPKLYTRGDGKVGQDITNLLRIIEMPKEQNIVVRGEFIIPKEIFETKYKTMFANPRNLVAGIINSKTLDEKTRDLHFVAYEVIHPAMKPSEQMRKLEEWGFETVQNITLSDITNESLSDLLVDWRTHYRYEIDGIIVSDDNIHPRKEGNPEHAFAFKMVMSDQIAEAIVVDVIWTPSKSGYLKPRVRIEPIRLGGVTIEYATGFNGNFIETNRIGVGAVIQIIRSGDVIPHIKSVTTPAEHGKMPSVPYRWTDTHVDIVVEDVAENITVREKNITDFFRGLEIDGLSSGNVKRIMAAGYDTIPKILKMSKSEFETVEGFKTKMIEKVYHGIQEKVANASLLEIMSVSNKFGRGIGAKKIKPILEVYPNILTTPESPEEKITMLRGIKGIGAENAKAFVENIPAFLTFLRDCELEYKLTDIRPTETQSNIGISQPIDTSHPLYQKHIVMTKVRDATIIEKLKQAGGILDDSIGKNTFVLIVKSKDDVSNKVKYAREHNIPVMIPSEFLETYF
jgi:NAD-dependent DNA ligase